MIRLMTVVLVILMTILMMALIPAIALSKVQGPTEGGRRDTQWLIAARYTIFVHGLLELQKISH